MLDFWYTMLRVPTNLEQYTNEGDHAEEKHTEAHRDPSDSTSRQVIAPLHSLHSVSTLRTHR